MRWAWIVLLVVLSAGCVDMGRYTKAVGGAAGSAASDAEVTAALFEKHLRMIPNMSVEGGLGHNGTRDGGVDVYLWTLATPDPDVHGEIMLQADPATGRGGYSSAFLTKLRDDGASGRCRSGLDPGDHDRLGSRAQAQFAEDVASLSGHESAIIEAVALAGITYLGWDHHPVLEGC